MLYEEIEVHLEEILSFGVDVHTHILKVYLNISIILKYILVNQIARGSHVNVVLAILCIVICNRYCNHKLRNEAKTMIKDNQNFKTKFMYVLIEYYS